MINNNLMNEEIFELDSSQEEDSIIKVIGVGGGGSNAVNHMYRQGITGVNFMVCNTDGQALHSSPVPVKVQLGLDLTDKLGAGNEPEKGEQSAMENLEDVKRLIGPNTKMIFLTAGMGGGTGTGAVPVIAKLAKEMDILTVAIVTLPFEFEGEKRKNQAIEGIRKLKDYTDALLIIHNDQLKKIYGDQKLSVAFANADNILAMAAKGIAEIITVHGYVNVDFADVETVMKGSGVAIMGTGVASGEDRASEAIKKALISPLLNNNNLKGARNILLNITSGDQEVLMDEITQIMEFISRGTDNKADIIWGNGYDDSLGDALSVTIVATGLLTEEGIGDLMPDKEKEAFSIDSGSETNLFELSEEQEDQDDVSENVSEDVPEDIPFEVTGLHNSEEDIAEPEDAVKENNELVEEEPSEDDVTTNTDSTDSGKKKNKKNWVQKSFGGLFEDKRK